MSSKNNYNTTYSAADIEKYLKGELSPREMHDLENAALEDPFLADALDGISSLHLSSTPATANKKPGNADDNGLSRDLDDLQTRLNARVAVGSSGNNTRQRIPRWSVAAAVILLLGLGSIGFYYLFFSVSGDHRIPIKTASAPRPKPAAPQSPSPPPPAADISSASPPAEKTPSVRAKQDREEDKGRLKLKSATASDALPKSMSDDRLAAKPAILYKDTLNTRPNAVSDAKVIAMYEARLRAVTIDQRLGNAKGDTVTGIYATAGIAPRLSVGIGTLSGRIGGITVDSAFRNFKAGYYRSQPANNSLVFNGTVLDNNDHPLPGASLTLNGYTNTGAVTDRLGQFSLHLPPQDSIQYLTVAMVGYEQKSLPLNILTANELPNNVIHLQPNESSLNEVVVTGYGSKRKETLAAAPSYSTEELDSLWQKASPVIGRNAYLQYLTTAQKTLALDSTIKGTETISFDVDRTGTLTSFKLEQSLSPTHDAAIIRLVKEGPDWILLKGRKVRAVVSLHF